MDPNKLNLVSCDTFVVLPPLTSKNLVIFGKNSDRPSGEVQEIVHVSRKSFPSDAKIECTYISIDAPKESYSVILSKPSWMWGAEMGANEFGVCIGNEAVWTKLNGPEDNDERLLGMDLVRLGLERGKTAKEALNVITEMLEKYGQGGQCSDSVSLTYHNGFLIADSSEAWVLETAGREWAAENVTGGFRNISNCLSIATKIDLMSKGLKSTAVEKGLWDGNGEFNFAKIYSTGDGRDERFIGGNQLLEKLSKDKSFDVKAMISVLRDEKSGICRGCDDPFPSVSSQVSAISSAASRPSCHWFTGTPDPKHSIFKPFIFCDDIKLTSKIQSPVFNDDPAKVKPRFAKSVDRRHLLYAKHESFYKKLIDNTEDGQKLRDTLKELENSCIDEVEHMLDHYDPNDNSYQIPELFTDCVESELRFYD